MSEARIDPTSDTEYPVLPPAFAELEPFITWALPTEEERYQKRLNSSMDDMREFEMKGFYGRTRHWNMLDIQVPVIAAVNGPCSIHSELPVMCDVVLASEDAYFQDSAHFPRGLAPGDGVHIAWPRAIGHSRARYYLLTGQKLSAQQALDYGAVHEVLPRETLMDRAWELAEYMALRAHEVVHRSGYRFGCGPVESILGLRPIDGDDHHSVSDFGEDWITHQCRLHRHIS